MRRRTDWRMVALSALCSIAVFAKVMAEVTR